MPTQETNDQLQRNLSTQKYEPKQVHNATQDNAKTKQKFNTSVDKVKQDRQSAFA